MGEELDKVPVKEDAEDEQAAKSRQPKRRA